ncbi:ABC transporter ATP-binding protein [Ancylobacter sp. MQZ15Z-1]|uniref:Spermidine/putrescine import ATP-binding protein PotA n=1 Tax=Ancylobacter mangrovi TaxID=2972472 RepID=A0A9X2PBN1_9HYPH|nr:ABC transporter ATP-binding protein [Ancylobacter mangrovi]MCS0495719.1 ABC transporter ATP-binding protein [Ancylobacter mangrovi]
MEKASRTILAVAGVDKTFEGATRPALDRISFSVEPGEFFSILGPSGSGKTTLLRMIAGFERPDVGRIIMDGEDITDVPPFRRDVRTVFQSYALFPHMSVLENVAYPLRMAGARKSERLAKARECLELVSMGDFAQRLPHQLSGGQRQRVALARAIVCRPRILLLDEPLGALDLRLRQQMQHMLVSLQKDLDIAFIYVTHDQGEALSMSDRVAVMSEGRISQLGTPREIYFDPSSEFVAQFVGRSNLLPIECVDRNGAITALLEGKPLSGIAAPRTGPARMAIRFECVRLDAPDRPADGACSIDGTVKDVLFLGNALEVNVRCGGLNIIAAVPAASEERFTPGKQVRVLFDANNATVFHG